MENEMKYCQSGLLLCCLSVRIVRRGLAVGGRIRCRRRRCRIVEEQGIFHLHFAGLTNHKKKLVNDCCANQSHNTNTYWCQSGTFVNRIITLLVFLVTLRICQRSVTMLVLCSILRGYDQILLVLIMVHLSTLRQSTIARRRDVLVRSGHSVCRIFHIGGSQTLLVQTT